MNDSTTIAPIENELLTAHTQVIGSRFDGTGRSDDGQLDVKLSMPGSGKPGTNPEQLFGVGYAACFLGALNVAAGKRKVRLPNDMAIDADVTLGTIADGNYQIAVKLRVDLPGLDGTLKRELVEEGHRTCPYSRATRGNIDVQISIV